MSLKKLLRILLGIQFALGIGLAILTASLFLNQAKLGKSQRVHFQSYLLADELRQSSDDLTRLARTYVATGDEEFERQYWAVLAIRNGQNPRPVNYNRIYWDFVTEAGQKPRPDGANISLRHLMHDEGFTDAELERLTLSQKYSDALVKTEMIAMNAVKGLFQDGTGKFTVRKEPDRALAIRLMNDEAYHKSKVGIMKPIDEFYTMFAERTAGDVARYERRSMILLQSLGMLIAVIMGMFGFSFVIVQRQITERQRAEEAQSLLSATIEQAHEGVIITDPQGVILYTNPAIWRLSGYGREDFLGQNPRILKSGLQDLAHYKTLWNTILSGGLWQGRMANRRRDGSLYTTDMTVAPVRNPYGQITALVATQRDVTQEVALEARLARGKSLETIGMVAGGLAHEIRNPLFAISTVSAALEKKFGENPDIAPFIGHIQDHVRRLSALTNDLLTLGRPVAPESFAPCRLANILAQVSELSDKAIPGSSERIAVACKAEFFIMGIEEKFVQVFLNLVQNALSIAPAPTPVTMEVRRIGQVLEIEVADVGPGIPFNMLDHLFHPFTSRRQGGTGLGLAIVQKLVEAHGGTVVGQNRKDGPGAVFTVTLSAAMAPADQRE